MIILDRDGVINFESEHYVKSPDEWHAIPGSLEAIARLNRAGHRVVVMTNQSGIGRGLYDEEILAKIHEKLLSELAVFGGRIEKIYYCPHHPDVGCECRKPKPGMLKQIQNEIKIEFSQSIVIGDSWRDIQAGRAVGCQAWLVKTGFGQSCIDAGELPKDVPIYNSLDHAVDVILSESRVRGVF